MTNAIRSVIESLSRDGGFLLGLFLVIALVYAWQRISGTIGYLRWRARVTPTSAQAHLDLGEHLTLEKPHEAEAEIQKAIELNPRLRHAYYSLAVLQSRDGKRPDAAERTLRHMIEKFPDDPLAYSMRGIILEARGDYSAAEAAYREAIRLAPHFPRGHSALASLLNYRLGLYPEAIEEYKLALRDESNECTHHYGLGAALLYADRPADPVPYLRKAIALNGKHYWTHILLGYCFVRLNRRTELATVVNRMMEMRAETLEEEMNLGIILEWLRRYAQAEASFRRGLEKDPACVDAYIRLAGVLGEALGRKSEAEEVLRTGLMVDASDPQLNRGLAKLLRTVGRQEEAIPYLNQVLSAEPDAFDAHMALAAIHRFRGEQELFEEAAARARANISRDNAYDMACLESICGNRELVFEHLREAAGRSDFEPAWAWDDPDLEKVRDDPLFRRSSVPAPW